MCPGPPGGGRRSGRIEAQRELILSALDETPDITIRELCTLPGERGQGFSFGPMQRVLKRHGLTRIKDWPRGGAGEAGCHEQSP